MDADRQRCLDALPLVSRTFAACIGLLPQPVQHQVLIAYLLCRIADTIEDTADLAVADKLRLLAHFRACLDDGGPDASPLATTFVAGRTHDEQLTRDAEVVLREFRRLGAPAGAAIRPWVAEMCDGMAGFSAIQATVRPGTITALESLADLDRYCYYVAGTVGHLLTALFVLNRPDMDAGRRQRLSSLATSFGLGLQLTNIIKDVADDRGRGWSFIPHELYRQHGLRVEDLLDPAHATAAQAVMASLIARASGHLDAALDYCTTLPASAYRLRLFCLTPLYFAVRTLALARHDPRLLDPGHKVKITRKQVYRSIAVTHLIAPSNTLVRGYFRRLSEQPACVR